jgi:hypothetical protein
LSRLFAQKFDFSEAERALAPLSNTYDSVVIYQSTNRKMLSPLLGADALIKITIPDYGADVVA